MIYVKNVVFVSCLLDFCYRFLLEIICFLKILSISKTMSGGG